jgi:hypothetical protein
LAFLSDFDGLKVSVVQGSLTKPNIQPNLVQRRNKMRKSTAEPTTATTTTTTAAATTATPPELTTATAESVTTAIDFTTTSESGTTAVPLTADFTPSVVDDSATADFVLATADSTAIAADFLQTTTGRLFGNLDALDTTTQSNLHLEVQDEATVPSAVNDQPTSQLAEETTEETGGKGGEKLLAKGNSEQRKSGPEKEISLQAEGPARKPNMMRSGGRRNAITNNTSQDTLPLPNPDTENNKSTLASAKQRKNKLGPEDSPAQLQSSLSTLKGRLERLQLLANSAGGHRRQPVGLSPKPLPVVQDVSAETELVKSMRDFEFVKERTEPDRVLIVYPNATVGPPVGQQNAAAAADKTEERAQLKEEVIETSASEIDFPR